MTNLKLTKTEPAGSDSKGDKESFFSMENISPWVGNHSGPQSIEFLFREVDFKTRDGSVTWLGQRWPQTAHRHLLLTGDEN